MGKGDPWDDSALIRAFDDAITKYKVMHSNGQYNYPTEEGNIVSNAGETESTPLDENRKTEEHVKMDNNSTVASNIVRERGETNDLSPIQGNEEVDAYAPGNHSGPLDSTQTQSVHEDYQNSQGVQDYNLLLNQYYELEEQRQKILQQLGGWNYNYSGGGFDPYAQWGTYSTSQEHQLPTTQAKTCIDATAERLQEKSSLFGDSDIIKTAMGAAEKAISSMEKKISANNNISEGKGRVEGENECNVGQNANSETELTAVLSAWYSAGFYTGKYLTEQALGKKNHG